MAFIGNNAASESPVAGKLLRLAGQSLREQRERLFDTRFTPIFLVIFTFWMVCVVEFAQKIGGQNLDPRFWMFLSILVTIYGGFKVFRLRSQARNLCLGERGERRMGEILDRVRCKGFVAYHDLPENGFNIDHVVVGPTGIYVIETKARTVFGSRTIDYANENELTLGGKITDNQPLKQARAAAAAIRRQLQEHLHQQYPVKPLVVFLGDWRINRQAKDVDVAVMTASQLENYFDRQQPELTSKEIAHICSHLERSARS